MGGGAADGVKWRETDKDERWGFCGSAVTICAAPRDADCLVSPRDPLAPPTDRRKNKTAALDFRARAESAR